LANVLRDALEFAFESQTAAGLFAGARLDIEIVPITACCEKCHDGFQSMKVPPLCPSCGSNEVKITGGTEVFIDSVDVTNREE
jgi:hydrogenase nickel incorporation protein HypA/HybF